MLVPLSGRSRAPEELRRDIKRRRNYPSPKFTVSKNLFREVDVASPYHTQPSELRNHMLKVKPCYEAKGCVRTAGPWYPH